MSDRNLPEENRAFEQLLRTYERKFSALERSVTRTGVSRTQEVPARNFAGGTLGDGGFWNLHPMIEFDIDPGAWLLDGQLSFSLFYNGTVGILGYQEAWLLLDWRVIGTAPTPANIPIGNTVEFHEAPIATPTNEGTPGQNLFWRTTIPAAKVVESTTGLTVRVSGMFTWQAGTQFDSPGSNFVLGPGILTATPL